MEEAALSCGECPLNAHTTAANLTTPNKAVMPGRRSFYREDGIDGDRTTYMRHT